MATKAAPPPPPAVPDGTPEHPYLYSDGSPIVYLDGETQEQYQARVDKMIADYQSQQTAAAAPVPEPTPVVTPPVTPPQGAANPAPVAQATAPVPPTPVQGSAPQDAVIPSTVAAASAVPQSPGKVVDPDAGKPDVDLNPGPLLNEAGDVVSATPGDYATMPEYMAAQNDIASRVQADHAVDVEPTQAEIDADAQREAELDTLDGMTVDMRLRRVEAQLGIRSPRLRA